eukprot:10807854-Alexandrium_andersonii.AAC.1
MRWAPVDTMVCVAQHARDYTTHHRRTTTTASARALLANAKWAVAHNELMNACSASACMNTCYVIDQLPAKAWVCTGMSRSTGQFL